MRNEKMKKNDTAARKIIRFNGRDYHFVAMKSEPWNEADVPIELAARYPEKKFTPCRWRFICEEGVIAAVPIGRFLDVRPERVPVEIQTLKEWEKWPVPVPPKERETIIIGGKKKRLTTASDHEELHFLHFILKNWKKAPTSAACAVVDLAKYRAIYENGDRDYFIRIDHCAPTAEETIAPKRGVTFENDYRIVRVDGKIVGRLPKAVGLRKLLRLLDEARQSAEPWRRWEIIVKEAGFTSDGAAGSIPEAFKNHKQIWPKILVTEKRRDGGIDVLWVRMRN